MRFEDPPLFECQSELVALYETLINVMFCAKSVDGTYLEVNRAFMLRTGLDSKRHIIGRTAAEIFNPDFAARYEEQDREVFATGETLRDALELIRVPGGDVGWYLTTKIPVTDTTDSTAIVGLVSVSRDLKTPTSASIVLEGLQHFVTHVRDNIANKMRTEDLASAANCSEDQLERRVRNVFGLTPKQYVLRVRVDLAAELLMATEMSLSAISAELGFYDQSDFTRRFARLTNQTPAQFRLSAKAQR